MIVGGLAIFGVGFWDDTRHLTAGAKFTAQLVVAAAVFFGGIRIMGVSFADLWQSQLSTATSFVVTTFWIVGTTNAFNLIDGSDGVAAGAALFASISLGVIFALNGDPLGALMATVLVGTCLGFLFFNFPPASVFLGDCGSLFLGFTLASLGVITTQKSSTLVAIAIPIIAVGIPLLDTLITIVRRFLRHQPIFSPDRGHIHHRLRDLGHSPRGVALLLYVGCAGCASLSMLLAAPGRSTVIPVFVVAAAVVILGVQRLKVPELTEIRRMLGRGFQQRLVISHNLKLYSLSEALEVAGSGGAIVKALDAAFRGSEFSGLELHVDDTLAGALKPGDLGPGHVVADASGSTLSLTFEHLLRPVRHVELKVPLYADDRRVGFLSFFRSTEGDRLYTDLRLVSQRLVPSLVQGLQRAASTPPEIGLDSAGAL
jgi:UDP-GlcNAc:undecaprenyl-phosphate GlcNAc-1-phosphate transferase